MDRASLPVPATCWPSARHHSVPTATVSRSPSWCVGLAVCCATEGRPGLIGRAFCHGRGRNAAQGIQPATGDLVYDQFEDGVFRTELETRVAHLRPTELLRPPVLSRPTERFLAHWIAQCGDTGSSGDDGVRVERLKRDHPEYAKALVAVTEFLHQADKDASRLVADVSTLPRGVLAALASLLVYLREFGLERSLRLTSNFAPFASRRTIVLSANTLRNLELLQNDTDGQAYGSLLWVLDHTRTPMGKRLLRKWVAQPLRNREDVEARLDAVAELAQVSGAARLVAGPHGLPPHVV